MAFPSVAVQITDSRVLSVMAMLRQEPNKPSEIRGQTGRTPISMRQATEVKVGGDKTDAAFFRRPAFRGISGRDINSSSEAMNSALPRGRPVCVERRKALISAADSVSVRW